MIAELPNFQTLAVCVALFAIVSMILVAEIVWAIATLRGNKDAAASASAALAKIETLAAHVAGHDAALQNHAVQLGQALLHATPPGTDLRKTLTALTPAIKTAVASSVAAAVAGNRPALLAQQAAAAKSAAAQTPDPAPLDPAALPPAPDASYSALRLGAPN